MFPGQFRGGVGGKRHQSVRFPSKRSWLIAIGAAAGRVDHAANAGLAGGIKHRESARRTDVVAGKRILHAFNDRRQGGQMKNDVATLHRRVDFGHIGDTADN